MEVNFEERIVKNYKDLKKYALKLTNDNEDANDLLQDTVFKALKNKEKFVEDIYFKTWLGTIMKNIWFDKLRSLKKTEPFINQEKGSEMNKGVDGIDSESIEKFILTKLKNKPIYLKVFNLSREGYSYKEISDELQITIPSVKIYLNRTRKILKDGSSEIRK